MAARGPVRRLVRAGLVVAVVLAVLTGLLWGLQRRLVYFPDAGPVPAAGAVLPGARDVVLQTSDGLRLGAWFLPGRDAEAPAVLVANGNGGHRGLRAPLARALSAAGTGPSSGRYTRRRCTAHSRPTSRANRTTRTSAARSTERTAGA